jgi:hypothetical protein
MPYESMTKEQPINSRAFLGISKAVVVLRQLPLGPVMGFLDIVLHLSSTEKPCTQMSRADLTSKYFGHVSNEKPCQARLGAVNALTMKFS